MRVLEAWLVILVVEAILEVKGREIDLMRENTRLMLENLKLLDEIEELRNRWVDV